MLRTVCDTSREEIRILIRVESKNRVESNELARVRPRGDRPITVIAIVPIESSRVKNFKRKRKKKRRGRRKERRNRAKSKKGANNGSGVSLRGNRRRVLGGGGLKMGLPGLINHRQSRESASKRPRPLKVNDENFVTGRSVRTMVDRGGPLFVSTPRPFPGRGNEGNRRTNG